MELKTPCEPEPPFDERQSFKKRAGPTAGVTKPFPVMPLDRVCVDRMYKVMGAKKRRASTSHVGPPPGRYTTADYAISLNGVVGNPSILPIRL